MQRFIWASTYGMGGLAAGCFSAFLLIQHSAGLPPAASGAWSVRQAGTGSTGIYARSHDLLAAQLPPPMGQITEAIARTDDEGQALSGRCSYRLSASGPMPGWWSISASATGSADPSLQASAHSGSVLAAADGSVTITASGLPVPGNWLKLPIGQNLSLVYWAAAAGQAASAPPFTLTREGCS